VKITDASLTLFAWESIPSTIYGHDTARPTGKSDLGLLRIATDEGIEGHAFLGTSSNPASLDGPGLYRYEEASRVGRAIEEMGFYWYEDDPLAEQDIYNYVKLKQKLHIPILATEYPIGGLDSYIPWITERATDFLRGDVAVKGGITTILKAAHLAEAFRMNFEVHHGGNSLNNFANLNVIMAIRNTELFEVLLPDSMQKYGLAEEIAVDPEGFVHAPTEPGLGAAIDFELIERKKIGVLS